MKRKIKITVETERVLVVRRRGGLRRVWCVGCGAPATFAPLGAVCALTMHDAATLRRLLVTGQLHAIEAADGLPLVCLRSAVAQPVR
ncbi:MAG: hypothetical protein ACJ74W_07505 [Pyrinomonadaceae bacterium]